LEDKKRLPFQDMKPDAWVNLAIAAVLAFYLIQIIFIISDFEVCGNVGLDYCAYYSAGKVINQRGFSSIYDLDILRHAQMEIYPQGDNPAFQVFGVMYLPVFLLPFKFLSDIHLPSSYLIWVILNLVSLIIYLRLFTKSIDGVLLSNKLFLTALLSLPVYVNFYEGQVNVWLLICAGEFFRNLLKDQSFKAGLWLGGWLLKPQLLILILPYILFKHNFKAIKGFIISSLIALCISLILIQPGSLIDLLKIFLEAGEGGVVSNPAAMINWRMLGWHIATFTSSNIGWAIIITGSLITTAMTLIIFRKRINGDSGDYALEILGLFAATCIITWHSHLHMSMILIPPMLYLIIKNQIDKRILFTWVFIPIFFRFFGYLIAYFLQSNGNLIKSSQTLYLMTGLPGLLVNLLLLGWTINQFIDKENKLIQSQGGIKDNPV